MLQHRRTLMPSLGWALVAITIPMWHARAQEPVIKPQPAAGTGDRLPQPRNVTAVQLPDGRIRVTWSPVPGATSYSLIRSVPPDPQRPITPNVTDTVFIDADVTAGKTYYYLISGANDVATGLRAGAPSVRATRSAGSSMPSLSPPTSVIARLSGVGTVTLVWQSPPGTVSSIVEVRNRPSDAWIPAIRTTLSSYSAGGLPQGMRMQFRVSAQSSTGVQSAWALSNEIVVDSASTTPVSTGGTPTATGATGTVAVTMGSALSLRVGATASAGTALGGASASRWVSLDEGIATVDGSGNVAARAAGRARILAIGGAADGAVRVTLVQVTVMP